MDLFTFCGEVKNLWEISIHQLFGKNSKIGRKCGYFTVFKQFLFTFLSNLIVTSHLNFIFTLYDNPNKYF